MSIGPGYLSVFLFDGGETIARWFNLPCTDDDCQRLVDNGTAGVWVRMDDGTEQLYRLQAMPSGETWAWRDQSGVYTATGR